MSRPVTEVEPQGERVAFGFHRLHDTGVLWLINRVVFHPRGFALAVEYGEDSKEPLGWSIQGDGKEPWRFEGVDEDDLFTAFEAVLEHARLHGRVPTAAPEETNDPTRYEPGKVLEVRDGIGYWVWPGQEADHAD